MHFEWDPAKARSNKQKHKVGFDEAVTVFYDSDALHIADPDHSDEEDRFILLGLSRNLRELVVCHCYRQPEDSFRILPDRKADRDESELYWRRK